MKWMKMKNQSLGHFDLKLLNFNLESNYFLVVFKAQSLAKNGNEQRKENLKFFLNTIPNNEQWTLIDLSYIKIISFGCKMNFSNKVW